MGLTPPRLNWMDSAIAIRRKIKAKRKRIREWRRVYLNIIGRNLDPDKISKLLHTSPDASGKRGELRRGKRRCKQGYWTLEGGPSTWKIETQMKNILKKISPNKHLLEKLIRKDETVKQAYLTIAFAPAEEIANACYCFDAKLINEFTSMGIDIALSIQIIERWERIFRKAARRKK